MFVTISLSFVVFKEFFSSHKSCFDIVVHFKGNCKIQTEEIQSENKTKQNKTKKETECDEKTPPLSSSSSSNIPSTQAGGCIRDVLCSADNTETEFHHNPLRDTPISLSVQLKEKPIPCQVSFLSVSLILLTAESPSTSLPEPVCCGVCACVSSQDIQTGKRGVETTGGVLQLGVNRGGEGSSGEGSHSLICFVCPELHKLLSENKTGRFDESE